MSTSFLQRPSFDSGVLLQWTDKPSLVIFSSPMLQQIMLSFEPLSALSAVPLSQAWQIFSSLACLVLREVFGGL